MTKLKGILLINQDGSPIFRVYNKNRTSFTDYDIHHADLSMTITETDLQVIDRGDGTGYITESKETLGRN